MDIKVFLLLNFIVPLVMILVGAIWKKYPVSDRNAHNGYNTPGSRKSQEHWNYAQSIAPGIFITGGKMLVAAELVLNVILWVWKVPGGYAVLVGTCVGFLFLFGTFYKTEAKIKERFPDT